MQESVKLYDPAFQVIVFVFLLSPSGNSMALWRRKLEVPDSVRDAYYEDILQVEAELKTYPVYVDELVFFTISLRRNVCADRTGVVIGYR